MKVKVKTATGPVLNWLVAKATVKPDVRDGRDRFWVHRNNPKLVQVERYDYNQFPHGAENFFPSTDPAHGFPLLTEARISRTIDHSGLWIAYWADGYTEGDEGKLAMHCDRSELVAGLRCLVELTLGPEVEVPTELAA